ncbi:MAG: CvpA family protein [Gammaproteobacteria bacterium]|nr:CvpA family protein [Gammaproteobacteria bacterium]
MPLPAPDIVMLIAIGASAAFGLFRGLVREVVSLAIWAAAFLLALLLGPLLAEQMQFNVGAGVKGALGFAAIFVVVLLAGAFLQKMLGAMVEATGLTGTDRTLGLAFGAVRGAILVIVALVALRPFAEDRAWWADSTVAPVLLPFEGLVMEFIDAVLALFGVGSDGEGTGAV